MRGPFGHDEEGGRAPYIGCGLQLQTYYVRPVLCRACGERNSVAARRGRSPRLLHPLVAIFSPQRRKWSGRSSVVLRWLIQPIDRPPSARSPLGTCWKICHGSWCATLSSPAAWPKKKRHNMTYRGRKWDRRGQGPHWAKHLAILDKKRSSEVRSPWRREGEHRLFARAQEPWGGVPPSWIFSRRATQQNDWRRRWSWCWKGPRWSEFLLRVHNREHQVSVSQVIQSPEVHQQIVESFGKQEKAESTPRGGDRVSMDFLLKHQRVCEAS